MPDATFPALHIRPESGWLNDPNGLCHVDGTYHVFFQYNPDEPVHGNVHWGHASSTDLLRWRDEPVALVPAPGTVDAAGCWSGCIVDDAGVPTAVYTATPDHAWNSVVALARSNRSLKVWAQERRAVMTTPDRPDIGEVRDPFVFTFHGHRYAVQGAGQRDGRPQVLLYGCDDLAQWTELGALLTEDDPVAADVCPAQIWECPNLVEIGDQWVLLLSLWSWVGGTHRLAGVRYLIGDLISEGEGLRFKAVSGGSVDDGPAFYAPQLLAEPTRTLMWGWSWEMGRTTEQIAEAKWAGVLTFPRELHVRDGALRSRPAAELVGLRSGSLSWAPGEPISERAFEIVATGPVVLRLVDGSGDTVLARAAGTAAEPARILVDGSIVESFDGGMASTDRGYPTESSAWMVDGEPGTVTAYALRLPPPAGAVGG